MNPPGVSNLIGPAFFNLPFLATFEALAINTLCAKDREHVVVAGFNCDGRIIYWIERAGDIADAPIDQEDILTILSDPRVVSIGLAHNHPSGDHRPSRADKVSTHKLVEFCAQSGVKVVEHIVIGIVSSDPFSLPPR